LKVKKLKIKLASTEEGGVVEIQLMDSDTSLEQLEKLSYRIIDNLYKKVEIKDEKRDVV